MNACSRCGNAVEECECGRVVEVHDRPWLMQGYTLAPTCRETVNGKRCTGPVYKAGRCEVCHMDADHAFDVRHDDIQERMEAVLWETCAKRDNFAASRYQGIAAEHIASFERGRQHEERSDELDYGPIHFADGTPNYRNPHWD